MKWTALLLALAVAPSIVSSVSLPDGVSSSISRRRDGIIDGEYAAPALDKRLEEVTVKDLFKRKGGGGGKGSGGRSSSFHSSPG